MSVQQLPSGVIKLISSTQVISSVSAVVKELVENSIDAGASVIDIKLERIGLEKIEIRDNGCGISKSDAHNVCLPNYTSKIYSYDDLERLASYGFRGEALNSLCAVSQVSITTKAESEEIASTYTYDNNGTIREVQPSHYVKGTIVTVTNLFKNVPVRRQYYENIRKATEELKNTEKVVKLLSVIHPKLRITIAHNKCLIWQKTAVNNLRQSLMQVYPHVIHKNLVEFNSSFNDISVEMLICKRDCNWSVLCQPLGEAILFFVNKRPLKDKKVEKVVLEEMTHLFASSLPNNKCPLTLISLIVPPDNLDVNLEPDKSKIFMKNHEEVLKQIRESIMLHFYEQPVGGSTQESQKKSVGEEINKKRKMDNSDDAMLLKEMPYKSVIPPVKLFSDALSNNILTHNENKFETLESDLLDLDATQFEENSCDNEIFSMSIQIAENGDQDNQINKKELHEHIDDLSECIESQDTLNFSAPFECSSISENLKVKSIDNAGSISNIANCDNNSNSLDNNESINNAFNFQVSLCKNSSDELKEAGSNLIEQNESSTFSEKDLNETIFSPSSHRLVNNGSGTIEGGAFIAGNESTVNVSTEIPSVKFGADGSSITEKYEPSTTIEKTLNQTTLSQWSKGFVNIGGETVEGGAFIANELNARCKEINNEYMKQSEKRMKSKSKNKIDPVSQNFMERSVSSQMGRKDLAGLTNFARTVRTEIIKENPGITFSKVASELANRWRNLGDDEKTVFSERSKAAKNRSIPATDSTPAILMKKTTVSIDASIKDVKNQLRKLKQVTRQKYTRVIGPLREESEWVCKIGNTVAAIHVPQLRKNVLLHRHLCHTSMPVESLDVPIQIGASTIGAEWWQLLLSLEKCNIVEQRRFIISDPRVLKNGFKIIVEEESSENFSAVIMETAIECRLFAVETLVEVLKLIQINEEVQHCRPAVIKRCLLGKVSQVRDSVTRETEIEEFLTYWVQQMSETSVCPSEIPICVKLHSFPKKNHSTRS